MKKILEEREGVSLIFIDGLRSLYFTISFCCSIILGGLTLLRISDSSIILSFAIISILV
jgi:hypothetical protein